MIVCDSRGTEITRGARVAYNQSGQVVPGVVLDPGEPKRVSQWHVVYRIRIENDLGHVSVVKNANSVLVLG
jgi:hypothetical protein